VYYTNMSGPVFSVAKASATEMGRQVKHQLQERGINIDAVTDGTLLRDMEVRARELVASINSEKVEPEFVEMETKKDKSD
jgi:hypothetical protein